jgi:hypothetical protein
MVSGDFAIEDLLGYRGMWLLGGNWVVRDFENFGSVETREWEDEIFEIFEVFWFGKSWVGFVGWNFGDVDEREPLNFKALCGFWEKLITTFKVDPCMDVCLFVRSFRHFVGCGYFRDIHHLQT